VLPESVGLTAPKNFCNFHILEVFMIVKEKMRHGSHGQCSL